MKVIDTALPDVKLLEPKVFGDDRGFFFESYNRRALAEVLGIENEFVQDNHSRSSRHVLRGLHYQLQHPQGKLVRVVSGTIYDVAVDLRKSSSTYGQWAAFTLTAVTQRVLWIPPGFAHGFLVVSETADVLYKASDYYDPSSERCLLWNDPELNIPWPIESEPMLSSKDAAGTLLKNAEVYP